jgi:predicted nucleic acid-binding protein
MIFVDTNYFLRFLLEDDSAQGSRAKLLFRHGARGAAELHTSTIVIFEIYWVLSSYYGEKKAGLTKTLFKILLLEFIKLKERELLQKALEQYSKSNLCLEDCYNLVYCRANTIKKIATFDKNLERAFTQSQT